VTQYLPIPPAAQTNSPLHAGGVINLEGGYGGLDARWGWHGGDLAGRPLDLVAGLSADRQRQHRTATRTSSAAPWARVGACAETRSTPCRTSTSSPRPGGMEPALVAAGRAAPQRGAFRSMTATSPGAIRTTAAAATTRQPRRWQASASKPARSGGRRRGPGLQTPTFNELGYRADGQAGLALDLAAARSRNLD
jgi:iron complex outermembrane receptor protein